MKEKNSLIIDEYNNQYLRSDSLLLNVIGQVISLVRPTISEAMRRYEIYRSKIIECVNNKH